MRIALLALMLGILPVTAFAQNVIAICIQVPNPFGGAANCVPISTTNPLPVTFN